MLILLEMAGFGLIAYGIWLVAHPAGFIASGVLACLLAFLLDRAGVAFPRLHLPKFHFSKFGRSTR